MLAFGEDSYQEALFNFSESMPKPKAIICLSSHSISTDSVHILSTLKNTIQHDFSGFPPDLYQIKYSCPGAPDLSMEVAKLLQQGGFKVKVEESAPLDHGIWIPLMHLYPKGDVPLIRISLPMDLMPAQILKLGHSLAKLREEGILLLASGGAVHNLSQLQWSQKTGKGQDWAINFEAWILNCLQTKNVESLMAFEENPDFALAHPSTEHFLPILFSIGAALPGDEVTILYQGVEYNSLSMLCFSLNHLQNRSLH